MVGQEKEDLLGKITVKKLSSKFFEYRQLFSTLVRDT